MNSRILDLVAGEDGFQKLLDRLLGMETDGLVSDLVIVGQLLEDEFVGLRLAQQQKRVVVATTPRQELGPRLVPHAAWCS